MSEISDMIQRLCPDGVEYRKLGRLSHCSTLSILLTMTSARRHLRWGGKAGPYRIRFCSSDNAFRPFPISRVIQILQLASLREPLCANGRHSEQVPSALPKSHNSARACKRVKTRLAFQRSEGKWASTYSNFPYSSFGTGGRGPTGGCCFVSSFRLPWLIR